MFRRRRCRHRSETEVHKMNNSIETSRRLQGRNGSTVSRRSLAARLGAVVLAGGLMLGASACSSDSTSESSTIDAGSPTTTAVAAAAVTATDGWARNSPMAQTMGAAYMKLTGGATDDSLVAATVPSDIAASVELHEVVMAGGDSDMGDMSGDSDMGDMSGDSEMGDMSDDSDMGGMMRMQEVPSIAVPAGATVMLEPGGYHLMLIGLAAPLTAGQTFDVTLEFSSGEKLVVPVEVRGS
jgi:copper(I)-binding protein